jgi:hypothetical protein
MVAVNMFAVFLDFSKAARKTVLSERMREAPVSAKIREKSESSSLGTTELRESVVRGASRVTVGASEKKRVSIYEASVLVKLRY